MTPDKVEEIVEDYHNNFPKCPQSLIGSTLRQEDVDELNRAIERGGTWLRTTLTQLVKEVEGKPKEVIVKIDEFWQRECLESIFGSEDISNIHWDYNNDDTETEYEMECVLRRLPKPLSNLSK